MDTGFIAEYYGKSIIAVTHIGEKHNSGWYRVELSNGQVRECNIAWKSHSVYNSECIRKEGQQLFRTYEEKYNKMLELEDQLLFIEKLIYRGEATREEMQAQISELKKEHSRLARKII